MSIEKYIKNEKIFILPAKPYYTIIRNGPWNRTYNPKRGGGHLMSEKWQNKITDIVTYNTKGTGAISVDLTYAQPFQLESFDLSLESNAAAPTTSENFTITKDAIAGAEYDKTEFAQDMAGIESISQDFGLKNFSANDILKFEYANTDAKAWALTIRYRRPV